MKTLHRIAGLLLAIYLAVMLIGVGINHPSTGMAAATAAPPPNPWKTVFLIVHLLGVAIGAGGAFMSDAIFFSSIKDKQISGTEFRFLKLGSEMVWIGLAVLVVSGIGLFALDPAKYLASGRFLAKMTIVALLTINGLLFRFVHVPMIERNLGQPLLFSEEFVQRSIWLFSSGAISMISWVSALVLALYENVPLGYGGIMLAYGVLLAGGISGAVLMAKWKFP